MSEQRYKSVKSGNSIQNILLKQKPEANNLSNKILSNNLYIDNDIEKENKKLFKKINKKENQEIYRIRHSIMAKTKNFTANELKRRKQYNNLGSRSAKNLQNEPKLDEKSKIFKMDWIHKSKFKNNLLNIINNNNNKDINKINQITEEKEKEKDKDKDSEDYYSKKDFIDDLVVKDKESLINNICIYKEYLKDIEKSNDEDLTRLINSGNNFGHHYSFKLNDIKLLSYKEEKKENVKIRKKENPDIDIVKLLRYTKRGNRKWFQKNIKIRSKERLNSFNQKFKKKSLRGSSSAIDIRSKRYIEKINDNNDYRNNNDIYMMGSTNSSSFSNFKNTLKTVKNEAEMILVLNQNFDKKRKTMEGFFKRNSLPKLEEYEIMFKTRNNFINNNKNSKMNLKNEKLLLKNFNKSNNLKNSVNVNNKENLKEKLINQDIFEDFKKTYYHKKIKWEKEDIQKERIKQKEKELIEETKKYLKEIKQVKRKAQLYSDPYSKRDNLVNNRIKLFARSLSGPFYSQKKLQSKLDDFNNYIELKEYEKKLNDENLAKTMKEEEKKRKEEAEEYKLIEKMKKNLANEMMENNEDEDKKLDYKFISSLKVYKKEDKDQPYKDYKEIYEIIKEKKRNGEYDNIYDFDF